MGNRSQRMKNRAALTSRRIGPFSPFLMCIGSRGCSANAGEGFSRLRPSLTIAAGLTAPHPGGDLVADLVQINVEQSQGLGGDAFACGCIPKNVAKTPAPLRGRWAAATRTSKMSLLALQRIRLVGSVQCGAKKSIAPLEMGCTPSPTVEPPDVMAGRGRAEESGGQFRRAAGTQQGPHQRWPRASNRWASPRGRKWPDRSQ